MGLTLASAGWDKTIRLWDVATRKQLGAPLRGHRGLVGSVAFSPDGHRLASSSAEDESTRLWDVSSHNQLGAGRDVCCIASANPAADVNVLRSAL